MQSSAKCCTEDFVLSGRSSYTTVQNWSISFRSGSHAITWPNVIWTQTFLISIKYSCDTDSFSQRKCYIKKSISEVQNGLHFIPIHTYTYRQNNYKAMKHCQSKTKLQYSKYCPWTITQYDRVTGPNTQRSCTFGWTCGVTNCQNAMIPLNNTTMQYFFNNCVSDISSSDLGSLRYSYKITIVKPIPDWNCSVKEYTENGVVSVQCFCPFSLIIEILNKGKWIMLTFYILM